MQAFFTTQRSNLLIAVLPLAAAMIAAGALPALAKTDRHAATVRTKVEKLGAGAHVMVKTSAGQEFHGHIESVGRDSFTLRPDNSKLQKQIAYNEVLQVRRNRTSRDLKWFLIGAAAATFVIVIALIA